MDLDKVIFIAKKNMLSERSFEALKADGLNIEMWPMTPKGLYREIHDVNLILVYLGDWTDGDYSILYHFLTIFPESWIPVALIGTKRDFKTFKNAVAYPVGHEIDTSENHFSITKSVKKLLVETHYQVQQEAPVRKNIYILDNDNKRTATYQHLFELTWDTQAFRTPDLLSTRANDLVPDLFFISYQSLTEDDRFALIKMRQTAKLSKVPLIIYGPQINSGSFKNLLPLKPKAYILDSSNDADLLATIIEHIH